MKTPKRLLPQLVAATLALLQAAAQAEAPKRPDKSLIERGRYLVQIAGCNDCHTPGYMQTDGKVDEKLWLTGDTLGWHGPWGTTYATNLRLFVANLSEAQWLQHVAHDAAAPADALVQPAGDERARPQGDLCLPEGAGPGRAARAGLRAAGQAAAATTRSPGSSEVWRGGAGVGSVWNTRCGNGISTPLALNVRSIARLTADAHVALRRSRDRRSRSAASAPGRRPRNP